MVKATATYVNISGIQRTLVVRASVGGFFVIRREPRCPSEYLFMQSSCPSCSERWCMAQDMAFLPTGFVSSHRCAGHGEPHAAHKTAVVNGSHASCDSSDMDDGQLFMYFAVDMVTGCSRSKGGDILNPVRGGRAFSWYFRDMRVLYAAGTPVKVLGGYISHSSMTEALLERSLCPTHSTFHKTAPCSGVQRLPLPPLSRR